MINDSFFTVTNLSAGYSGKTILSDVSFTLAPGTLTAVFGANGCGKTTLLRALCGLIPSQGDIVLDGHPIKNSSRRRISQLISYIPQRSGISSSVSVIDAVLMGFNLVLKTLQRPSPFQRSKALAAILSVGLAGLENADYMQLSVGQQQLCILARTMVQDTKLLVLDEPDSALDFYHRYMIFQKLVHIVKNNRQAGIICLHDPNPALEFCDRIILLKNGTCTAVLCPKNDSLDYMEKELTEIFGPVSLIHLKNKLIMVSDLTSSSKELY